MSQSTSIQSSSNSSRSLSSTSNVVLSASSSSTQPSSSHLSDSNKVFQLLEKCKKEEFVLIPYDDTIFQNSHQFLEDTNTESVEQIYKEFENEGYNKKRVVEVMLTQITTKKHRLSIDLNSFTKNLKPLIQFFIGDNLSEDEIKEYVDKAYCYYQYRFNSIRGKHLYQAIKQWALNKNIDLQFIPVRIYSFEKHFNTKLDLLWLPKFLNLQQQKFHKCSPFDLFIVFNRMQTEIAREKNEEFEPSEVTFSDVCKGLSEVLGGTLSQDQDIKAKFEFSNLFRWNDNIMEILRLDSRLSESERIFPFTFFKNSQLDYNKNKSNLPLWLIFTIHMRSPGTKYQVSDLSPWKNLTVYLYGQSELFEAEVNKRLNNLLNKEQEKLIKALPYWLFKFQHLFYDSSQRSSEKELSPLLKLYMEVFLLTKPVSTDNFAQFPQFKSICSSSLNNLSDVSSTESKSGDHNTEEKDEMNDEQEQKGERKTDQNKSDSREEKKGETQEEVEQEETEEKEEEGREVASGEQEEEEKKEEYKAPVTDSKEAARKDRRKGSVLKKRQFTQFKKKYSLFYGNIEGLNKHNINQYKMDEAKCLMSSITCHPAFNESSMSNNISKLADVWDFILAKAKDGIGVVFCSNTQIEQLSKALKEKGLVVRAPFDCITRLYSIEEVIKLTKNASGTESVPLTEFIVVFHRKLNQKKVNAKEVNCRADELSCDRWTHVKLSEELPLNHEFDMELGKENWEIENYFNKLVNQNSSAEWSSYETNKEAANNIRFMEKNSTCLKALINCYTKKQDKIVDVVGGTFSIGVCAINCERQYVGVESNSILFKAAAGRLFLHWRYRDLPSNCYNCYKPMSHLNHIPFCSSQCENMQKFLEKIWEMEESRTQNKILTQFEGNSVLPTPIAYAARNIAPSKDDESVQNIMKELTESPDSCFTVKRRTKMNAMDDKEQENEKSNESQEPKNKLSIKPLPTDYLEESFKEQAEIDGNKYEVTKSYPVVDGYGVIAKRTIHKHEIIGPVFGKVVLMDKKEKVGGMDDELFEAGWRRREIKIIKSEIESLWSQFNLLWEESQQNKKSELYVIAHELSAMGRINSSHVQDHEGNQTRKANAKFELTPFTKIGIMDKLKKVCGDLCKIPPLFIYHVKAIETISEGEEILINYGWSDSEQVDDEKEDGTESESSDQGNGNNERLEINGDSNWDEDEVESTEESQIN